MQGREEYRRIKASTHWTLTFFRLAGGALAGSFPLSLPPDAALLLLQPLLLGVGLVPATVLHQALVGPAPAVGGRHALLCLVQGQRQGSEVVHGLCSLTVVETGWRTAAPKVKTWRVCDTKIHVTKHVTHCSVFNFLLQKSWFPYHSELNRPNKQFCLLLIFCIVSCLNLLI